jgi:hypothetical protein
VAEALRYVGQGVVYLLVAVVLGYFSSAPSYTHFPADQALIKLSFAHGAERKGECRRLGAEELARLPPNLRRPVECPRERWPVVVELVLDDATLYQASLPPTGLAGDGPSRVYRRFAVAPGSHRLIARLRDSARAQGFDYVREATIELAPGQNFVIDFRKDIGGFVFD